ncbi:MAG: histidine kinase [Acidobacteria bacterium]|nr:histidine kinase [Acidobacteriota bacterium]
MLHEPRFLSAEQYLLVTLIVQLAGIAALSTMLVRFRRFRTLLLTERRDWPERLKFMGALGVPLAAGVASRLLLGYHAADVSLGGAYLAGLVAGPYAGAIVGLMVGLTALAGGEWIAIPLYVGCGFAGGGLREICPKDAIWHFSPFVLTGLFRYLWKLVRRFEVDWQMLLIAAPIALEILRQILGHRYGIERLFYFPAQPVTMLIVVLMATTLTVAIPIKIWNSARIEHKLQEQEALLLEARIEALTSQMNPHFLFNTLTSISSLIRTRPDTARMLINRLAGLLRRRLRAHDHFIPLRDELTAVDEYLDIECVRFGPSLCVDKDLDPATLDVVVPSMILQPLVENSIKHGFADKMGQRRITLRSHREGATTVLEVIDNGLGIQTDRIGSHTHMGIGLANISERLRVIYGMHGRLAISSEPGHGTQVRLEIPDVLLPAAAGVR